ncbi:MAG TPA: hypothetical protein V6C84_00680 [Coleofasciculaceae cyanobacterium]|jgi:hypothetical protein
MVAILEEDQTKFNLRLLKGRLAQVVVQTVFEQFSYIVRPYGYENYLSTLLPRMKKDDANDAVKKIRNSPDFFVYDNDLNKGFLIEVKSTTDEDETCHSPSYYNQIPLIQTQWADSVLVVYCSQTANIYCLPVSEVPLSRSINLPKDFKTLPQFFERIDEQKYNTFLDKIRKDVMSQHCP